MAPTFWDEHEAANFAFQESQLLNIINDYSPNMYHKFSCRISSLGGEEYSQESITISHFCCCQKVFSMPYETFLALRDWLTKYISLKKSYKHFLLQLKVALFLYIMEKRAINYAMQEKFQYFSHTVSDIFYEVFILLLYLYTETVNLYTSQRQFFIF